MSPRGGWRGGGRPKLQDKGLKPRQTLSCRIDPEAYDWLQQTAQESPLSVGEIIDLAIFTLKEHPEKLANQEDDTKEYFSDIPQLEP